MEIRDYKVGDETSILELFQMVFRQELSLENWYWRFRDNPAGKYLIKLLWEDDRLIGHYAVSPTIMSVNGNDVLTALSLTTMTHPGYRGKGIFKKLSKSLYEELENELTCKAVWGYPNNNSHYGFVKSLKWSNLSVIHTLGISTNNIKSTNSDFKVKKIDTFDENISRFIESKISDWSKVFVKKDVKYLNWRFIKKPNSNYDCYEFESKSGYAILLVKFYFNGNENKYDLNILDCFMDNYEEMHNYINYILNDCKLDITKITVWKNLFDPDHLLLERQGFSPVLPQTYLSARIHHSMSQSFSDYRNWYISMSDSDVF